jgi:hypothetical protein
MSADCRVGRDRRARRGLTGSDFNAEVAKETQRTRRKLVSSDVTGLAEAGVERVDLNALKSVLRSSPSASSGP